MQNTAKKRRVTAKIRFIVKVYKVRGNQQEYYGQLFKITVFKCACTTDGILKKIWIVKRELVFRRNMNLALGFLKYSANKKK
jgi:hypothetical protein